MEPVYVLLGPDPQHDLGYVDLVRERELYEDTMNGGVRVEPIQTLQYIRLSRIRRQSNVHGAYPDRLAGS
jgi:hypothetical protein